MVAETLKVRHDSGAAGEAAAAARGGKVGVDDASDQPLAGIIHDDRSKSPDLLFKKSVRLWVDSLSQGFDFNSQEPTGAACEVDVPEARPASGGSFQLLTDIAPFGI